MTQRNESPFGKLLRGLREAASLSQEELAQRSGLSWRAISALERGERRKPHPRTVRHLADALRLPDRDRELLLASVGGRTGDPTDGWPVPALAVAQLPAAVADFTCRDEEVARLRARLRAAAGSSATVVAAISGKPGVGKSALAVHVAHQVRADFPDGQLYANLGDVEDPAEVLDGFLRALGISATAMPASVPERAALYRSLLAGGRWLVVLDNAAGEEQVRHLVPGAGGCAVVVTCARPLTALPGVHQCHLADLEADCGVLLLGAIAGEERVRAEAQAARAVVRSCGGLPLAVRIAGAILKRKPHWPVARLTELLADEHRVLDELRTSDLDVRTAFALSYRQLPPAAARVFRLLALLPGPDFPAEVVASMIGEERPAAVAMLERLHDAQLVEAAGVYRYRLHDLVRAFARERVEEDEPRVERQRATEAAVVWYALQGGLQAAVLRREGIPHPPPSDHSGNMEVRSALEWFDRERTGLVGALGVADGLGLREIVVDLAIALSEFFSVRGPWTEEERVYRLALESARRLADVRRESLLLNLLGTNLRHQGRLEAAIASYRLGLDRLRATGDRQREALLLNDLGVVYRYQARWSLAEECQTQSLAICRERGDGFGEAIALNSLGLVHATTGRYAEALVCYTDSLAIFRRHGERHREGWTLQNLGQYHQHLGKREEALADIAGAIDLFRQLDDRDCEAWALAARGFVYADQRRWLEARASCERGLAMLRAFGDRSNEAWVLANLARILREMGEPDEGVACCESALLTFRQQGMPFGTSYALNMLGIVHRSEGRWTEAEACHRQSLGISRQLGDRAGEAEALVYLGDVDRDRDRLKEAEAAYEESLTIRRRLENRHRDSLPLRRLAALHVRCERLAQAMERCQQGLDLARGREDRQDEADFLIAIGDVQREQGRSRTALATYGRSLAVARALAGAYRHGEGRALQRIADLHRRCANAAEAEAAQESAIALFEANGDLLRVQRLRAEGRELAG